MYAFLGYFESFMSKMDVHLCVFTSYSTRKLKVWLCCFGTIFTVRYLVWDEKTIRPKGKPIVTFSV